MWEKLQGTSKKEKTHCHFHTKHLKKNTLFYPVNHRSKYDRNKEYIMSVGRMMASSGAVQPNLQFKITAFMSGDLVVGQSFYLLENPTDSVGYTPTK